jgi:hypothetical protein
LVIVAAQQLDQVARIEGVGLILADRHGRLAPVASCQAPKIRIEVLIDAVCTPSGCRFAGFEHQ